MRASPRLLLLLFAASILCSCSTVYYAAWEQLGKHKRDLLRDYVFKARNEQEKAKEEFKDALTRLKEITQFDGGKLEQAYRSVEKDYAACASRSESIQKRIADIDEVAKDLFSEWEKELSSYTSDSLRTSSQAKLKETRKRYDGLYTALKRTEASMKPVLLRLKDQTLYLKHNLNAQAIGALRTEVLSIEGDVQKLLAEMNTSIARSDEFIRELK